MGNDLETERLLFTAINDFFVAWQQRTLKDNCTDSNYVTLIRCEKFFVGGIAKLHNYFRNYGQQEKHTLRFCFIHRFFEQRTHTKYPPVRHNYRHRNTPTRSISQRFYKRPPIWNYFQQQRRFFALCASKQIKYASSFFEYEFRGA